MWRNRLKALIPLFPLFLIGLIPLLWFKPGFIASGHDMGYSLDPLSRVINRIFIWSDTLNLGSDASFNIGAIATYLPEAILQLLGVPIRTGQIIVFMIWFVLPGLSMFYLLKTIIDNKDFPRKYSLYFLLSGSIFYSLNHYLLQAWFVALKQEISFVIVTPILIAFLIKIFTKGDNFLLLGIIGAFLLTIFNGTGGVGIPIVAGLGLALIWFFIYFGFISFSQKHRRKNFFACGKFITVLIIFFILFNAYWILPFGNYVKNNYTAELNLAGGVAGVSSWVEIITRYATFDNLLRLQGFSGWYDIENHPYSNILLKNPFFIIISFVWSLMVLTSLILKKVNRKDKVFIGFFFGLLLLTIFFMSGTRSPLGFIFSSLLNIPGFATIRTPFYKFGYMLWIGYAVLISYSFSTFIEKISQINFKRELFKKIIKLLTLVLFLLLTGIYSYPFFTGVFFKWDTPLSTMVRPPQYSFDFQKWINEKKDNNKILLYPRLQRGRADQYTWNYWSLTPFINLLTEKSVISDSIFLSKEQYDIVDQFYKVIESKDEKKTISIADLLDVKFILFRKDVQTNLDDFPVSYYENILSESPWIKPVYIFDRWVVYELPKRDGYKFLPLDVKQAVSYTNDVTNLDKFIKLLNVNTIVIPNTVDTEKIKTPIDRAVITAECNFCDTDISPPSFPIQKSNMLSTSPFYSFLRLKERINVKISGTNQKKTSLMAGYALRRIDEIKNLSLILSKTENKFSQSTYAKVINETFADVEILLDDIYKIRSIEILNEPINYPYNQYMESFTTAMANETRNLSYELSHSSEFDKKLESIYEKIEKLRILGNKNFWRTSQESSLKFTVNIPKLDSYTFYLVSEDPIEYANIFDENSVKSSIVLENTKENKDIESSDPNLGFNYGKISLDKGTYKVSVNTPQYKNLLSVSNVDIASYGDPSYISPTFIKPNQKYLLSFKYKENSTRDTKISVTAVLQGEKKQTVASKVLTPKKDEEQRIIFETPNRTREIILGFNYSDPRNNSQSINIEKLKMHQLIKDPILMLLPTRRDVIPVSSTIFPDLQKHNPTFYAFNIKSQKNPFFILLKQGYSEGWRLFKMPNKMPLKDCTNIVCQATMQIYTVIKGRELEKSNHYMANNYANAWYIDPNNLDDNSFLAVIYFPQIITWIGFLITFSSVFIVLGSLAIVLIKNEK